MAVQRDRLNFPCDYSVPVSAYRHPVWSERQLSWVSRSFTHVLIEAMRPLTGPAHGDDCSWELPRLRRAGVAVALVAHGSELRLPSRHRELYPFSPFASADPHTQALQGRAERVGRFFADFDGAMFVSTPDLLDFAPRATWLPTVVDGRAWRGGADPLRRRRPVVLHVPSHAALKGSRFVDEVAWELHRSGRIEYRRLEDVPPEQMPALVRDSDIVVDQLHVGWYGVMAVQAMYAGRVVLAHLAGRCRDRVPYDIPIVEADPVSLRSALDHVLEDPNGHRTLAAAGVRYADRVHGGPLSAAVLASFLGVTPERAANAGPETSR